MFLPTYRRANLLSRAINSLLTQTVTDWVCEVHNDAPQDNFPSELVRHIADPRIHLVQHTQNLGAIETFNRFYQPTAEPFYALLEDDNTWEPSFLATMLATLDAHPEATLAWCNQRIDREEFDGSVHATDKFANPLERTNSVRLFAWSHPRQVMGALHANGAMLLRSRSGEFYPTPKIPFGCVEAFRERMFRHPLVYVTQPLATFTITVQTARQHDLGEWGAARVALAATFVKHAQLDAVGLAQLCAHHREQSPPTTDTLIAAAFACPEAWPLFRFFRFIDWFRFMKSSLRHPCATWRALSVRARHPNWWDLLDRQTSLRFREASGENPLGKPLRNAS